MIINYCTNADQNMASFRYRVMLPAREIREMGHEVLIGDYKAADAHVFLKHFTPRNMSEITKNHGGINVFDISDDHFGGEMDTFYRQMIEFAHTVTCPTEEMSQVIFNETGKAAEVIEDPYEFPECEPGNVNGMNLMWYGHPTNLQSLYGYEDLTKDYSLEIICNFRENAEISGQRLTQWSPQAMINGFERNDVVIIPNINNRKKQVKSHNRMIEAIRQGLFVVANEIPSYKPFEKWMYLGDIKEGLEWTKKNKQEIPERVRKAQKFVRQNFSPELIARKWLKVLSGSTSDVV